MALLLRRVALAHGLIVLSACASPTNDAPAGSDAAQGGTSSTGGVGGRAGAVNANAGMAGSNVDGAAGSEVGAGGAGSAGAPAIGGGSGGGGGVSGDTGAGGSAGAAAAGTGTNAGSAGMAGSVGTAGSGGKAGSGGAGGSGGTIGVGGKGGAGGKAGSSGAENGGGGGSCEQTATLVAVADANINAAAPTTNYGPVAEANIVRGGAASSERALFEFDFSPVPPGATIKSAKLELTVVNNPGLDKTVAVHRVAQGSNRSWLEGQVTWQEYKAGSSWTASGADFVAQASDSEVVSGTAVAGSVVVFQVLSDAESFYATPSTNFGFLLKDSQEPASSSGEHVFFATRENAALDSRPKLVLTYCP